MPAKIILTNNPLVINEPGDLPVQAVTGRGLEALYLAALDLVQSGHKLLSTPLPPNLPLMRAPYRSLVLDKSKTKYDAAGIIALEKARERISLAGQGAYSEKQALDAAFIYRDLL